MKRLNFPFTAIIGQDRMKKALILNVIDPKIGGVLLTGHQGTGKSTAVRSLTDILPEIEVVKGCPFSCDPHGDPDMLCDRCRKIYEETGGKFEIEKRPIALVNLPLGVTEDMVCGSLDLEKVLQEGIKSLHPGLLAKANRGILYIDEINLLQDHIVDILLDAAASGVNIIEREGVSITHPARFILIGSMNPEEGELRPQINDRLGLEVTVEAPTDPKIRAEIARRVMEFSDNPKAFIKKYEKKQQELKERIIRAKEILHEVEIPDLIYRFVAELVNELGIKSHRADITFIRCARAAAAFRGSKRVEMIDLDGAIDLVFEHRLRALRDDYEPEEIEAKIQEVFGKIREAYESTDAYQPNRDQDGPLKASDKPQKEFRRQPYDPDKVEGELPEMDDPLPHNEKTEDWARDSSEGLKVIDDYEGTRFTVEDLKPVANFFAKKIANIFTIFKKSRQKMEFAGRGSRTKITTAQKGRYIAYRKPIGMAKNIAFDATLKRALVRQLCISSEPLSTYDNIAAPAPVMGGAGISAAVPSPPVPAAVGVHSVVEPGANSCTLKFPIRIDKDDIMEKVFEFSAPLSLYFILDASGSMSRYIPQMADVIKALHQQGYEKKDKTAIVVFKGKKAHVLQRPTTNVSRIIAKLPSIKGTSYTPLAAALVKVENMIKAERMKSRDSIPVVIICSDLGANVSLQHPELKAQTQEDFNLIAEELKAIAQRFGRKKIRVIILIPKKGRAIRFLGVNPVAIEMIKDAFKTYANAEVFEFDGYNPRNTIIKLKKIL